MKKIIALTLSLALLLLFAGCGAGQEDRHLNAMALKGPTGVSICKLADDNTASGSDYTVTFAASPEEITGKLISGECDIACVPTNLASVLYNKTKGDIRVCAVTTLGVLYLVDTSGEINSLADLAGKDIGATGKGSNPEYILNKILADNGLSDSVNTTYYAEHAELASMLLAGKVQTALLPEPFVTQVMVKSEIPVNMIDIQEEWGKQTNGVELAQGVIVARKDVIKDSKAAVDKFLDAFASSSDFAIENVSETAQLCEKHGIIASAAIAQNAISRCNITFINGDAMKNSVSTFLNVLFEADATSVGGKLPDDDFYYVG